MKKFVIHLTGQPATGKSTFANLIAEEFSGSYSIFYDRLKWQLSGYQRDRDRRLVRKLQESLFLGALNLGVPIVIVDFFFENEEEYQALQKRAETQGYEFLSIVLHASREVLGKRFDERLERSKEEGFKMSVTDKETFMNSALREEPFVPGGALQVDTTETGIGENLTTVLQYLASYGVGK